MTVSGPKQGRSTPNFIWHLANEADDDLQDVKIAESNSNTLVPLARWHLHVPRQLPHCYKVVTTSRKGDMDRSRAVVFPVFWVLSPFSGHLAEAWLSSGPSEAGKVSLLISWHHTVEAFLHVPATASLPLRFTQSTGGIPNNGYYTDSCIKIQRTFPAQPHNSVGIRTTNTNSTPSSYALIFLFRFHEPPAYFQTAT